jgi:hypothetical protein
MDARRIPKLPITNINTIPVLAAGKLYIGSRKRPFPVSSKPDK